MNDSMQAVYEFLTTNGYYVGHEYKTVVSAQKNNKCIYQSETEWQITYNPGYEQYGINILWTNEQTYHSLGLYGTYNTKYQVFKYQNGVLLIIDTKNHVSINVSEAE